MKPKIIKKILHLCAMGILLIIIGGLVGWFVRIFYASHQQSSLVEVRENSSEYHFINPLLFVDNTRTAPEYDSIKNKLNEYVASELNKQDADYISIYFRDLNSGKWTGINENQTYEPSSMLKVLVMMSYINKAETEPDILNKKFPYTATIDPGQYYKPVHPLPTGDYSVRDLIEAMIVDSDNTAASILLNNNKQGFVDVYKDLNLPSSPTQDVTDFMSPKSYSALFRTLYNATYLSKDDSEQALGLLSITTFSKGLTAGVPQGTTVAHKFGEHTNAYQNGQIISRELHDCGIIYYPQHPYLLCVMTKGQSFPTLETIIQSISKITYEQIDADVKKNN